MPHCKLALIFKKASQHPGGFFMELLALGTPSTSFLVAMDLSCLSVAFLENKLFRWHPLSGSIRKCLTRPEVFAPVKAHA